MEPGTNVGTGGQTKRYTSYFVPPDTNSNFRGAVNAIWRDKRCRVPFLWGERYAEKVPDTFNSASSGHWTTRSTCSNNCLANDLRHMNQGQKQEAKYCRWHEVLFSANLAVAITMTTR